MTKRQKITLAAFALLSLLAIILVAVSGLAGGQSMYANKDNWAILPADASCDTDVFFIAPTVYGGDENNIYMSLTDEKTKSNFVGATNMEKGIYDAESNFYAPYYRQVSLYVYKLDAAEREKYLQTAYKDIKEAFTYYMDNYNGGRPVILAGFSQGGDMVLRLLEDFYADEKYQDKLVAAYAIGAAVTPEMLTQYPQLKPAQGETDTGCIISFNSEAEGVDYSVIVPETTVAINPLNWKTDSTPADAALNEGACFTDYSGAVKTEIPQLCGCYIDETRGTLKVTGVTPQEYPAALDIFTDGIYHIYDYQFFYRNLQQNVSVRIESYMQQQNTAQMKTAA